METMAEKKLYEAMFLVDSGKAASDWDGVNAAINKILDRAGAEIVSMRKWDDRRLAYDIKRTSRGTYMLCYFKAEGQKIQGIEKDVQLSENVIRVLILSTEQMSQEDIERETPATKAEKDKEKSIAEQPPEAEVSKPSDQQERPAAEQARIVGEAKTADDVEQAVETENPEEIRKTEDVGQAEEVEGEESQDFQP